MQQNFPRNRWLPSLMERFNDRNGENVKEIFEIFANVDILMQPN